jgi:hypothetical protein
VPIYWKVLMTLRCRITPSDEFIHFSVRVKEDKNHHAMTPWWRG